MTDGQYRALVAYLMYWTPTYSHFNLDYAMRDIGITIDRAEVIEQLAKAGYDWDDETRKLRNTFFD